MQFSDRPEIKGDFSIEARGSGALLVREKQQENLMIYSNISSNNPNTTSGVTGLGWIERLLGPRGPIRQITKTDEIAEEEAMMAEQQSMMPSPDIQKLQLEADWSSAVAA